MRAVFFDRDNTLIDDPGFITEPDQVVLRPGAAEAVRRVRAAGYRVIVVSNQSGVARGLLDEEQLSRVHQRLRDLLARDGAELDAIYHCPYLDGADAVVERYRRDSDLRKPRPGMLLTAAREWGLDLAASWMIGDRDSDVQAGAAAGCRTIRLGLEAPAVNGTIRADYSALTIMEAAAIVEKNQQPSKDSPSPGREDARQVLGEIRDAVSRLQRHDSQEDFSFKRLLGSLAQMLALVTAVWGVVALFATDTGVSALPKLTLAVFLQLLALTIYASQRQ